MLGAPRSVAPTLVPRILALRVGALGDTLLALPGIAALRTLAGARGSVDFVGSEPSVRLARAPRLATAVHSVDRSRFRALYQERTDDDAFLSSFDLVVAWSRLPLLGPKLEALGIPSIEVDPLPPAGVHAADHLFRALAPLGISGATPVVTLEPDPHDRARALDFLERNELRPFEFVAVHPSSGSPRKNWPPERFRELGRRIREERKLLWIEGEADEEVVTFLERHVPAPVGRRLPLEALGATLSLAHGYIGNDSGVTHLAAAVDAPTIALFGPTDPKMWAPRGERVGVADFGAGADEVWEKARLLFRSR